MGFNSGFKGLSIGFTSNLYIRVFVFLESDCDLNRLFSLKHDLLTAIRRFVISSNSFKDVSSYFNGAGFAAIRGVGCYHIFGFAFVDD